MGDSFLQNENKLVVVDEFLGVVDAKRLLSLDFSFDLNVY